MPFSPKKQSRILSIMLVYQKIKNNIWSSDHDFFTNKIDIDYFKSLFNSVVENFDEITVEAGRYPLSDLMRSCIVCFIAENRYLKTDSGILIPRYIEIIELYGESDSYRLLQKISTNMKIE